MALIPKTNEAIKADVVDSVLAETGFVDPTDADPNKSVQEILTRQGADLSSAVGNMVQLMNFSETDSVKLEATKSVLTMHGVNLKEAGNTGNNQINIIIEGSNSDTPKKIDAVLCPVR